LNVKTQGRAKEAGAFVRMMWNMRGRPMPVPTPCSKRPSKSRENDAEKQFIKTPEKAKIPTAIIAPNK